MPKEGAMTEQPSPEEQSKWHRRFAVECNNLCWELTTKARSAEEDVEMLNAAHAAAFHWSKVGTELNDIRAKMLLGHVHALLGYGASAMEYAQESHSYLLSHDAPDWEVAFAHAILAQAASVVGDDDLHARAYSDAQRAIDAISDPEDRAVVLKTFDLVPSP
jgi:hypothetical protein